MEWVLIPINIATIPYRRTNFQSSHTTHTMTLRKALITVFKAHLIHCFHLNTWRCRTIQHPQDEAGQLRHLSFQRRRCSWINQIQLTITASCRITAAPPFLCAQPSALSLRAFHYRVLQPRSLHHRPPMTACSRFLQPIANHKDHSCELQRVFSRFHSQDINLIMA